MAITAQLVKELREKTGAGMMDCKKALSEVSGDLELAIDYLRKQGLKASAGKASRVAADGLIVKYLTDSLAVLLELNCETDFVAKNEEIIQFADAVTKLIADKKPKSVEELLTLSLEEGLTVDEKLNLLVSKIGEKISLRRFKIVEAKNNNKIGGYVHMGSKIAVLVTMKGNNIDEDILKDVAMHIAAASPQYLNREDIPQSILEKEKEIFSEQLKAEGKPDNIIEKILKGKIAKFSNEVCLNEQVFIKDPTGKNSVAKVLKEKDPSFALVDFTRYQVGEGIEKKADDFASEVASMAK